jgi:Domain of unknown function (DUF1917)
MDTSDESGFLSDESDFYGRILSTTRQLSITRTRLTSLSGDEASKQDLENRTGDFSPTEWWANKKMSLTGMADAEMADTEMPDADCQSATILYNPYEGQVCARQLGESIEDFLRRLPPSTTPSIKTAGPGEGVPWIYIANPFLKPPTIHSEYKQLEFAIEGPPDEESDWAQYVVRGGNILGELTSIRNAIEKERAGQAKASITRAVNSQKEVIVQKLLDTAAELHCTSGKVR